MTNEWAEFKAYTEKPQYISMSKNDKTYMGRFTVDMIKDFTGFSRIFTIIARGYLFHDKDGNILSCDPYERISYAKNALLAWCSINDRRSNPEAKVDYRELAPEFPELVNNKGNGWYITHIRSIFRFAYGHYDLLSKPVQEILPDISEGYSAQWKKRVGHFIVPIFDRKTKSAWGVRFDDAIADALEAGPLRTEEYVLPDELKEKLDEYELTRKTKQAAEDLMAFYYANKQDDCEWVVLPVVNFNAYYRSTTFEKNILPKLPREVFVRETRHGLCRFKIVL